MHSRLGISVCVLVFAISTGIKCESAEEWRRIAQEELRIALSIEPIKTRPKNVIFFLGDGMGIATLTASRIFKGQQQGRGGEEGHLIFERFPHVGLSKTYCDNTQTTDSAASATAYLGGVKTNRGVIGVNHNVKQGNCSAVAGNEVSSVLHWAQKSGKATGVVTTTRITHATPGASYAHSAHRDWEDDVDVPEPYREHCKDISRQLVEDEPGRNIKVLLGGGRRNFIPHNVTDIPTNTPGRRLDGRNLLNTWKDYKDSVDAGNVSHIITSKDQLESIDAGNTKNLLGLFGLSHLEFALLRDKNPLTATEPSLKLMTQKAIQVLQGYDQGFFLLVEGGRIDTGHHRGRAKLALTEAMEFDAAIEQALKMVSTNDTLVIVTADHSHTLGLAGFAPRGNSILKFGGTADDGMPYLTLSYANGPGAIKQFPRRNLTDVDTENDDFVQDSLVPRSSETHGGEDVAIYATGPFSHLFHSLHEQNYIAHALDYAACYNDKTPAHCNDSPTPAPPIPSPTPAPPIPSPTAKANLFQPTLLLTMAFFIIALYKNALFCQ